MPRRAKVDPEQITTIYEKRASARFISKVKDHINRESLRLITNINDDMRDRIGEVLKEGEEAGRSVAATASKLLTTGLDEGIFKSARKRAYLIARTELHRSRQQAAVDVYREARIGLLKWIGIPDDGRICSECRGRHGRTFRTSDLSPADMPPIHPRCRCRLVPHDFDITITPKRGRRGKILETKISPTPKQYRYIIKVKPKKVKKSMGEKEVQRGFVMNIKKSNKNLFELKKSKNEGKLIPRRIDGSVRWTKSIGDDVWIISRLKKAEVGDTILLKGQPAKVTAVGKDGVTARSLEDNTKYNVLHENVKLLVKSIR